MLSPESRCNGCPGWILALARCCDPRMFLFLHFPLQNEQRRLVREARENRAVAPGTGPQILRNFFPGNAYLTKKARFCPRPKRPREEQPDTLCHPAWGPLGGPSPASTRGSFLLDQPCLPGRWPLKPPAFPQSLLRGKSRVVVAVTPPAASIKRGAGAGGRQSGDIAPWPTGWSTTGSQPPCS